MSTIRFLTNKLLQTPEMAEPASYITDGSVNL